MGSIVVDPSQVQAITVDPSQVTRAGSGRRDSLSDALAGLREGAGGVAAGAVKSLNHPLDAIASVWHGMTGEADQAAVALNKGDLAQGLIHTLGIMPVLGPSFSAVLDGINDPNVDAHELGRRVGQALTLTVTPDLIKGATKGAAAAVDVAPAVWEGVKAGAETAGPDILKGAAKAGAGTAVAGMLPGGPLRYAVAAAPAYAGGRQILKGLSNGTDAGIAAFKASRAASVAPTPMPQPASAAAFQPAVLDQIAVQMGYKKGFASVPADGQQIIRNLAEAALKAPPPPTPPPPAAVQTPPIQPGPVTAAAPAVVPPPNAVMRNGVPVAEQLRDLLAPGARPGAGGVVTINPETAPPVAAQTLQEAMRDLPPGAPKAIARANYAADQETGQAAAVYEAAGRAAKSQNLSQMLYDEGLTSQKVSKWSAKAWEKAASDRGMPQFSQQSRGEVIQMLKNLEGSVK